MRSSGEIPYKQQVFRPITPEKDSRSSDLQLEQLIIAMALNDIKEIKEGVDADCNTFKKEINEIRIHLQNAEAESKALERELGSSFKRLKKMFFEERPKKLRNVCQGHGFNEKCATMSQLDRAVITMWEDQAADKEEEEREREVPIIVDLLRMIRWELEDLGKKTRENRDGMLKEITHLKNQAHRQHLSIKSKNEGLDKKFLELKELIQGCCTIRKIPLSILEGSKD